MSKPFSSLFLVLLLPALLFGEDLPRARAALVAELRARQRPDGGFGYRRGGMAFADATAWSMLALTPRHDAIGDAGAAARARAFLQTCARGPAYAATAGDPEPSWMTGPVTLALLAADPKDARGTEAARWLLTEFRAQREPGKVSPGWPWSDRCGPFVEPTTLALCALAHAGAADSLRATEGLQMVVTNQSKGGGWSLYAKRPHVYHTGLVLSCLRMLRAGAKDPSKLPVPTKLEMDSARDFLVRAAPSSPAPLDLAVATLALAGTADPSAAPFAAQLATRALAGPEKLDTLAAAIGLIALRHALGEPVIPLLTREVAP